MPFSLDPSIIALITPWLPVAVAALIVIAVIFLFWIITLEKKIRRLLGGGNAKSIEAGISGIADRIKKLEKFRDNSLDYLETVENRLKRSFQAGETIRYNPFKGTGDGGNQSFATALLNENGDGVILSSLYSRDRVSVFGKPIRKFKPQFELSEEEGEALSQARKTVETVQSSEDRE